MQNKQNSAKSTQTWVNVWEKWANEYEHEDLDKKLQMFYAEVRTSSSKETATVLSP